MKKSMILTASLCLLLTGCNHHPKDDEPAPNEIGPVVDEDPRSDEEKELEMIQGCISDYNTNRIPEVEEYLNTQLHPLPLEVESLPEISSLKDLTKEDAYLETTNAAYAGSYLVNDKYKIIFLIYEPTGNSFWLNGRVLFQIDTSLVTVDDPQYTEYRTAMSSLLAQEKTILNWLYGLNLTLGNENPELPGYYEVLRMGSIKPTSPDEIRAIAESVFTREYLEENFYYSAFYSDSAMFKESNGAVYCAKSDMIAQESSSIYNPHYIIAAEERDGIIYLDMLSDSVNEVQPDIKRLTMAVTPDGYRLPAAY